MSTIITDNGSIKILDYNANEARRRTPITSNMRVVKIPTQSSYLEAIQKTIEKMSKEGASSNWVVY